MNSKRFSLFENQSRVGRKLAISLFLFGSLVTLITTAFQLYREYSTELDLINGQFVEVQQNFVNSLDQSVWYLDKQRIKSQLNGLLQLRDIVRVSISINGIELYEAGDKLTSYDLTNSFDIKHTDNKKITLLGVLTVHAIG